MKRAIVVGTGAGGAAAARALAGTMDVTILEAGSDFHRFDGDMGVVEALRSSRLLFDPRTIRLLFPEMRVSKVSDGMALVRGIATGGTTTLATGNALRCDEELLRRGIDLGDEFRSLQGELPISTAHRRRWRPVTRGLFEAGERLGLHPAVTPKLVDYSRCTRCGRCVLGCPSGAKWDSRRFVDQAVERGARLVTRARVERVVTSEGAGGTGRATGVVVRSRGTPAPARSRPGRTGRRRSRHRRHSRPVGHPYRRQPVRRPGAVRRRSRGRGVTPTRTSPCPSTSRATAT